MEKDKIFRYNDQSERYHSMNKNLYSGYNNSVVTIYHLSIVEVQFQQHCIYHSL